MEKKRKSIQVYAIIVCIVAIVTFIICAAIFVSALIDRGEPLSGYSRHDLSSFANYKMEVMKSVDKEQAYVPDDAAIKDMYEAAKQEKINNVLHETKKSIIVTSILIVLSIILFVLHWMMIKKYNKPELVEAT